MTPGQTAVYAFLCEFRARHGYSPTFAEIAKELRVSRNAVHQRVAIMARRGEVTHEPGVYRSLCPNGHIAGVNQPDRLQAENQSGTSHAVAGRA